MAMKVVWAALLLAYGASTGAAMHPSNTASSSSPTFTLDMAPDSVDDRYHGCDLQMAEKVEKEYLPNERNTDADFKKAWDEAVGLYDKNHKQQMPGMQSDVPGLKRQEAIAVYVYTSVRGNLHRPFNEAVRTQGPQYESNFKFHALHFYLTKAVQNLRGSKLGPPPCLTVYRRTHVAFQNVAINTQVRFGSFASSSRLNLKFPMFKASEFGDKSCFEIVTCMGGNVFEYSIYENEGEVLIPPYEVFKVTDVKKKSEQKDLPCEVVYRLESTKQPSSNFNCALFKK